MTENTNLTTTITSDSYAILLHRSFLAGNLAERVAQDWIKSAEFGFNEPSEETKKALMDLDRTLYEEALTEYETRKAAAAARAEEWKRHGTQPLPYLAPDSPGVPLEIKIGDDPAHAPQITCENPN